MLAGAGPAYPAALVLDVAEAESIPAVVFREAVVALGAGIGVARDDGGLDGWPPGLDGLGEAVDLGDVAGRGVGVEPPQPVGDQLTVGVGPGKGQQRAQLFLDDARRRTCRPRSFSSSRAFHIRANE